MIATGLRNRFRGVFGFPVTPFHPDLSLDLEGLARNVDRMAGHPFCALVAAGGTGELYSLTSRKVLRLCGLQSRRSPDACPSSPAWASTPRSALN